ncbi:Programmed cell death protein 10 [Cichlidogyrus casuarinus]|uniref:Programmed cell death protein 10 n=1 Tax=Cichlidogyrus casuarinus TaxID=1844966 RepID=A0ABD2QCU4_9PLAT
MSETSRIKQVLVFDPVFAKLESFDPVITKELRSALFDVELQFPGFSQDFLIEILNRLLPHTSLDITALHLRMSALKDALPREPSKHSEFNELETCAFILKGVLARLPDEINDRKAFVAVIKETAKAIKNLLDATKEVHSKLPPGNHKISLEDNKSRFINYSRKFSGTLKQFFTDKQESEVFKSALLLVNQTNLMVLVVRDYR